MVMSYGVKTRACLSIVSLNVRVPNRCSDISCFNADHRFWWDDNNTDFSMPDETWLFKSNIFKNPTGLKDLTGYMIVRHSLRRSFPCFR